MTTMNAFLIELLVALTVSVTALLLLKNALLGLLTDLCGGVNRARFWNRFTQLMLLIGPLLVTVMFDPVTGQGDILDVGLIRDSVKHALLGGFMTLTGMGYVIWKTILTIPPEILTTDSAEAAEALE